MRTRRIAITKVFPTCSRVKPSRRFTLSFFSFAICYSWSEYYHSIWRASSTSLEFLCNCHANRSIILGAIIMVIRAFDMWMGINVVRCSCHIIEYKCEVLRWLIKMYDEAMNNWQVHYLLLLIKLRYNVAAIFVLYVLRHMLAHWRNVKRQEMRLSSFSYFNCLFVNFKWVPFT